MTDAAIREAIAKRLLIQFEYEGLPRIVEPHVYGMHGGRRQLLGYQVGGASRVGHIPAWHRFDLDAVTIVQITNRAFAGRRVGANQALGAWDATYAMVA